ncbi:MAG: TlpA family protein disulfide reductase [Acidobacteriota bacterium]|nr:TlpA family protein disulfide reductase [Acidobacteriota bacterium]MDQ5839228.1 TlpA family protein disulfide reductase [Acidobacteriota bacterium]
MKAIPDEVFNQELKDLDGRSFFLSNYRGQVFVINIWATWCGPCRYEIPELKKVYKKYSGRGVEFIGLTVDNPQTDAEQVWAYLKVMKINYKLGWIDGPTLDKLLAGRLAIPQTFVVAADGRIVWHVVGFVGRDKEQQLLGDSLEKALNPTPAQ